MAFKWPVRVYYEDTDAGGIVYHANYLKYFERARTEWLRSVGFEQDALRDEAGIIFVVRSIEVQYKKPALFNDELSVSVELIEGRRASLVFNQSICYQQQSEPSLSDAIVRIASLNAESMKPQAIPDFVIKRIN